MESRVSNLAALLPEKARLHQERTALVEYRRGSPRRITFSQLAERVSAAAANLHRRGVQPGDRVLLFVPMSIALYVELLAVLHAGATAVFLDAWSDRARLDRAVRLARPAAFIGTPRAHALRLLSPAVRGIPIHLLPGGAARGGGDPTPVDPSQPALITLTTGSTGPPRAAPRSHALLWAQHRALSHHLGMRETDVDMPALPVFVLNNLALGIPSVLPDFDPRRPSQFDAGRVYGQIAREGVTTAGGSPAFFEHLAGWCQRTGRRLPLRALFTGGAPLLPRTAREILAVTSAECHLVYGSTEAEPISGIPFSEVLERMKGRSGQGLGLCVGRPVPEIEVRLVRPVDGPIRLGEGGWPEWEVPPGEVGEVVVAGEHVLGSYLENPEADRRAKIRDGDRLWHRTGDAAFRDAEGRLWLAGRVAHRVVRGGRTWWPLPVEIGATEHLGARHAAYLGIEREGETAAVLCVEGVSRPSQPAVDPEAVLGVPVDEVLTGNLVIPRDPRHATKTDVEKLRAMLSR